MTDHILVTRLRALFRFVVLPFRRRGLGAGRRVAVVDPGRWTRHEPLDKFREDFIHDVGALTFDAVEEGLKIADALPRKECIDPCCVLFSTEKSALAARLSVLRCRLPSACCLHSHLDTEE